MIVPEQREWVKGPRRDSLIFKPTKTSAWKVRAMTDNETDNPVLPLVLTCGKVAAIFKVAPRTVAKWIDTGTLRGYRLPGSKDRRVHRAELIRLLASTGIDPAEFITDAGWSMPPGFEQEDAA